MVFPQIRMIAWEVTRSCNLACRFCRASSERGVYPDELSKSECFQLIDEIVSCSRPIIILTGGEPLLRPDIFDIAEYGRRKGLMMVMAPNGTLLCDENIEKIIRSGIKRISVSLDGPDAATHDNLRKVPGAFNLVCQGIARAKKAGIEFQINSTISQSNIIRLPEIIDLAKSLGAVAHHIFLLVPAGRAKEMTNEQLTVLEYEEALRFLAEEKEKSSLEIKITCAPHFNRILLQERFGSFSTLAGRGCMAATGFCFISHVGDLQPCGYLEIKCGNVREQGFKEIWFDSQVLNNLRDWNKYEGKCGRCEFKAVCGGCRARAYAKYNNYLADEPYCAYEPKANNEKSFAGSQAIAQSKDYILKE